MDIAVAGEEEGSVASGGGGDNCCYLCNECSSSFASLEELESHMASHLGGEDEEGGRRAGDENSPSSSDTSFPLDETMEAKEEAEAKFPCRFCSKLFTSRSLLNIHYTHTHRDKPQYECEDCGRIFSVKRELATHRRIHSGEQTHACAQCGKEFGTRQLLKKHWMWHTGQRSHVCPHCGKAFFQKGHLTQHLMIHAGGRPHVCQLCSKTFIFKFDLNRHMKIHAERGYSCVKCGKAFLKEALLVDHQAKCTETGPAQASSPVTPRSRAPSASVPSTPERKLSSASAAAAPLPLFPPPQQPPPSLPPPPASLPPEVVAALGPQAPSPNGQRFVCILCMQEFPSQSAYSLHISYVHLRDAMFNSFPGSPPTTAPPIFPKADAATAALFTALSAASKQPSPAASPLRRASDSALLPQVSAAVTAPPPPPILAPPPLPMPSGNNEAHSPAASASPSPASQPSRTGIETKEEVEEEEEEEEEDMGDEGGEEAAALREALVAGCGGCAFAGPKLVEAAARAREAEAECARLREKMSRVRGIASNLLESCSDFDKLWILHSKKVYSQIQSVLNCLD